MYKTMVEEFQNQYHHLEWREFACGWSAAFINITLTYPIYKIIFRQMLGGISAVTAFHQLHSEGIYFLYRGVVPPLAQKTLSLSVMFGVYENVRKPLVAGHMDPYAAKAIGGIVSGTAEVIFMPFERIQTLLASSEYHLKFRNTYHAFKVVGSQYGFSEYYRGIVPILLRNGPSNVLFFVARDEVNTRLPKDDTWLMHNIHEFVCGAVIGATLSSVFYPLNVLKVTMQSQLGGKTPNIFVVMGRIYRERGSKIRYVYHGVEANLIRAFLGWGVMNAAYENMRKFFFE